MLFSQLRMDIQIINSITHNPERLAGLPCAPDNSWSVIARDLKSLWKNLPDCAFYATSSDIRKQQELFKL